VVFDGDFLRFSRRNHPKPGAPQASSTSVRTVSSASPILASSGSRLSISARQRKFHEVRRDSEGQNEQIVLFGRHSLPGDARSLFGRSRFHGTWKLNAERSKLQAEYASDIIKIEDIGPLSYRMIYDVVSKAGEKFHFGGCANLRWQESLASRVWRYQ